jgi:putative FmdB family regulatory protein
MPTYEYICEKCGHQFEHVQPISARSLARCPKQLCAQKPWGKGKVKRAISGGGGLLFKGSGFYTTDYRSESYKAAAKKETAPKPSGDSKPASGTDSKPAPAKVEAGGTKASPAKT